MSEQPLDESRLAEIEARAEAATAGPWGVLPSNNSNLAHVETQEGHTNVEQGLAVCSIPKKRILDAEFIAHARTDIPDLLAEVSRLTAELAQVKGETRAAIIKDLNYQIEMIQENCRGGEYLDGLNFALSRVDDLEWNPGLRVSKKLETMTDEELISLARGEDNEG